MPLTINGRSYHYGTQSFDCHNFQLGTAWFGATIENIVTPHTVNFKGGQAAKPGKGGELAGGKNRGVIPLNRGTEAGVECISPGPQPQYSIEDLAQIGREIKAVADFEISVGQMRKKGVNFEVKFVSKYGAGNIAKGVIESFGDEVLLEGLGGSTGATPLMARSEFAMPLEIAVVETWDALMKSGYLDGPLKARISASAAGYHAARKAEVNIARSQWAF